jgi:hypothetical protein
MGRTFLVKVRTEQLRANLSAADGEGYSRADVRQWLRDAGFQPAGGWWRVDEADLLLDPAEVSEAIPLSEAEAQAPPSHAWVA